MIGKKDSDKQTYSEAYAVLLALGEDFIRRIPSDVLDYIKDKSDVSLMPQIVQSNSVNEQGLCNRALAVIGMLKLNYLCDSEEERARFLDHLQTNEEELKRELGEARGMRELLRLVRES